MPDLQDEPRRRVCALRFIDCHTSTRRFEVPDLAPHMGTALAVLEGYRDADQGRGVGLAGAMNVALADAYRTETVFTTDRHFRIMVPLTGHAGFRPLPENT